MKPRSHTSLLSYALALAVCGSRLSAQMHHVDKPETVTRAIGVYEWTGDLKKPEAARLVPVTVFLDGRLENAGTYLAHPVPLALAIGNLYSIEKAGDSFGTLELNLARDVATQRTVENDNTVGNWYGYGKFTSPAPPKKSNLKPTVKLAPVNGSDDDERPHFVASRNTDDTTKTPPATPGKTDTDGPVLKRNPNATTDTASDDDPDRPTLGHRDDTPTDPKAKKPKKEKPGGYVTPAAGSLNDDPDRPTIRRGQKADEGIPPLSGLPPDLHQAIAVSDPGARDLHLFTRDWDGADDHAATLAAMQKLALALVQQYLATNALTPAAAMPAAETAVAVTTATTTKTSSTSSESTGIDEVVPPKLMRTPQGVSTATVHNDAPAIPPATVATSKRPVSMAKRRGTVKAATPPAPVFAEEQIRGYQLSYGGLPTFVYSVKVPAKNAKGMAVVYVSLVAQRLPSGELQPSLMNVTDSTHLDRVPWLRFIDVVDADGSHRASMLFELRTQRGRQFGLYRLVSATAEQTFLSSSLE